GRVPNPGGVTERPKVHDWKSCVRATVPRVRIPPPPQKMEKPASQSSAGFFVSSVKRQLLVSTVDSLTIDNLEELRTVTKLDGDSSGVLSNLMVLGRPKSALSGSLK